MHPRVRRELGVIKLVNKELLCTLVQQGQASVLRLSFLSVWGKKEKQTTRSNNFFKAWGLGWELQLTEKWKLEAF